MRRRHLGLLAAALIALGGAFLAGIVAAVLLGGVRTSWFSLGSTPSRWNALDPAETLTLGTPRTGVLDLARSHERRFALDLPERAVALLVTLSSRGTELDLSARREARRDEKDGSAEVADFEVSTDSGEATLAIGRFSDPPLSSGRYVLKVAWTSGVLPRTVERRLEKVPFTIEARVFEARTDGNLAPGRAIESTIDEESGGFRTFRVEVPPQTSVLRIDLTDVSSDLDLYARRGDSVLSLSEDVRFAQHPYGRETLTIGQELPPLEPGTWYVDVVDVVEHDRPAPFRILATFSAEPPKELLAIPDLVLPFKNVPDGAARNAPRGAESVERALSAVVEIATDEALGSGTLLTADGWLLTNAHVVARLGGGSFEEVVVSPSIDPRRPPVELFRGHVERVDEDSDLALVRITSGFYGQALPQGYVFPTVAMGEAESLAIGDPIWLVGYPSTGGQGSRVTINCTRGVVSGYETADFGPVIKTDAEITSGNSGGAAIDERGRIVGVPTSLVELGSGQMAYVHPLSAIPAEWRELLNVRAGR